MRKIISIELAFIIILKFAQKHLTLKPDNRPTDSPIFSAKSSPPRQTSFASKKFKQITTILTFTPPSPPKDTKEFTSKKPVNPWV